MATARQVEICISVLREYSPELLNAFLAKWGGRRQAPDWSKMVGPANARVEAARKVATLAKETHRVDWTNEAKLRAWRAAYAELVSAQRVAALALAEYKAAKS